jgi:membrane fusion protein (multidrug efflux system)
MRGIQKMTPRGRRAAAALLAALLAAAYAYAPGGGGERAALAQAPGAAPLPVVGVAVIEGQQLVRDAELVGQLEADESVVVSSEVPGIVAAIAFEEGEPVRKGQVLFRLRDDEQRARLHEAQAVLRMAQDSHARLRDLAAKEIASDAALKDATSTLAAEKARVEVAQVALDRTQIRAPFDGVAGARRVSPGARVEPGVELVRIESIAELKLSFTVPEEVLPLVRKDVPLELSVAPYPGVRFPAAISFVSPSVDSDTRQLLLKAHVPNAEHKLRPGMFAQVHAQIVNRPGVLLVPESAIIYSSNGSFVWRLDAEGAVQQAKVQLGARQQGVVEVASGLAAGDRVVVTGTQKLAPGMRVEGVEDQGVRPPGAVASGAGATEAGGSASEPAPAPGSNP